MMEFKMPNFKASDANTKEEKLIVKLERDLIETSQIFLRTHQEGLTSEDIFTILKDGSLAYAGRQLLALSKMLGHKEDIPRYIEECRDIFECYLKQIKELS